MQGFILETNLEIIGDIKCSTNVVFSTLIGRGLALIGWILITVMLHQLSYAIKFVASKVQSTYKNIRYRYKNHKHKNLTTTTITHVCWQLNNVGVWPGAIQCSIY